MYVAMTRARKRLYLCYAQTRMLHGQPRYCLPSQFLDEIPPELLKLLSRPRHAPATLAWTGARREVYAPPAAGLPDGLRVGMNVRHARFGLGVIIDAEGGGGGGDARVQINFGSAGTKWLALEFAKLEKA
jgi:DNA helicase-2/ATP-dependent DNA helicase PcrA